MKNLLRLLVISLGFVMFGACGAASPQASARPTLTPAATVGVKSLPTLHLPGAEIVYKELRVAVGQAEITTAYLTEYGSSREPPAQQKFLWIHILLTNTSPQERPLPASEHFSVLYAASEFKPSYGHRQGFVDYTTLKPIVYPEQVVDAWLRFDIPVAAGLQDLQVAFLPESFQVNFTNLDSAYSWADHPLYLWRCVQ